MTHQNPNPNNDPDNAVDADRSEEDEAITALLVRTADEQMQDFDPGEARERFDALRQQHQRLFKGGLIAFSGMLLGFLALPPLLARAMDRPSFIDGGRIAFVVTVLFAAGAAIWWVGTKHRLARALEAGPPEIRSVTARLEQEGKRRDLVLAAIGLFASVGMVSTVISRADELPLWFTIWVGVGTLVVLGETARRCIRVYKHRAATKPEAEREDT